MTETNPELTDEGTATLRRVDLVLESGDEVCLIRHLPKRGKWPDRVVVEEWLPVDWCEHRRDVDPMGSVVGSEQVPWVDLEEPGQGQEMVGKELLSPRQVLRHGPDVDPGVGGHVRHTQPGLFDELPEGRVGGEGTGH